MTSGTRLLIAGGGTGGHLMPALAIAEAIRRLEPSWEIALVGAIRGVEAAVLPGRGFRYYLLPFEPIYRRQWWRNWRWPALAVRLVGETRRLLDREHPTLVLGTGGYASGPVLWMASQRGVPSAILEQDVFPGVATRWLARRVDRIFLGAPEAADHLPAAVRSRIVVTGSPIAPPTPERRVDAASRLGLVPGRPTVVVMGGSQGSLAINRLVEGWLGREGQSLADRLQLIWVTGKGTYREFAQWHRPPAVRVVDFLDPVADGYAVADLVVGRAGMMTLAEISAWGLPSILIPLPTAAADHQTINAAAFAAAGAAVCVRQDDLDPDRLGSAIVGLLGDRARLAQLGAAALKRGKPEALATIVAELQALAAPR
ncbi:MAG: UDP-N-acetylglucosamine--N-acetylmuramyl-(pentapeptide) pyrophosphoryl-undecaprenol N-acetylglucosamine transferase [Gemmatimonadetes bacterium]|nr:UDP-N-acetylglucosamine--N-acetylmuramyl-(pentapeptide) pyrophosphoryl-undecaprenol N-acetylglucosamine transferase [Gemmatimonadota bacterium]